MRDDVLTKYSDCVDEEVIEKYLRYEEEFKVHFKFFSPKILKVAAVACICFLISCMVIFTSVMALEGYIQIDFSEIFNSKGIDYAKDYDIAQVIIHTSPVSSKVYVFDEKDDINDFLHKTRIIEADYKYIANNDFDPALSLYIDGGAVEILIVKNDGQEICYYTSIGGTIYKKTAESVVYTDNNTIDYYKLIALLKLKK